MKFKDMPYKRVDYDKTAEQFKTLTKRVKEAKSGILQGLSEYDGFHDDCGNPS